LTTETFGAARQISSQNRQLRVKLEALQNMQSEILKLLDSREIHLEDSEQLCDPTYLVGSLEEKTELLRQQLMKRAIDQVI
jgi:hypothetical protein